MCLLKMKVSPTVELFIIDPDGVIQAVEINAGNIGRDASALFDKIKAAQYVRKHPNEVCPAKWKEGTETLKPGLDLVGKDLKRCSYAT